MDIVLTSVLAFASTTLMILYPGLFFGDKGLLPDICWAHYLGIDMLITLSYFGAQLGRWIDRLMLINPTLGLFLF